MFWYELLVSIYCERCSEADLKSKAANPTCQMIDWFDLVRDYKFHLSNLNQFLNTLEVIKIVFKLYKFYWPILFQVTNINNMGISTDVQILLILLWTCTRFLGTPLKSLPAKKSLCNVLKLVEDMFSLFRLGLPSDMFVVRIIIVIKDALDSSSNFFMTIRRV